MTPAADSDRPVNRFDQGAAAWDQNQARVLLGQAVAEAMAAHLRLAPDLAVLDLGAGTGPATLRLAPAVGSVLAVDTSAGMLEVLAAKIRTSGFDRITTRLWNIESDPLLEDRFDILVSSMTLHHLADLTAVARNIHALLRSGGQIALADLEAEPGDFHGDNTGVHHYGFTPESLLEPFRRAGFQDLAMKTIYVMEKPNSDGLPKKYNIFLLTGIKG